MAYGAPNSIEGIKDYYTDIRGGVAPSVEHIGDLVKRYEAIGGVSPLYKITVDQAEGLQKALGSRSVVYFGMKHSRPFIKDAVGKSADEGVDELLCIAIAPHYSITGTGSYISRVKDANTALGNRIRTVFVNSWHLNRNLIEFWSRSILKASVGMKKPFIVFSAHSLPEKAESTGPYKGQLLETSAAVAEKAGITDWGLAFQSQSSRGEKWYGPTIPELIEANMEEDRSFVIAPIGFVSDNLEILYDIDIVCRRWAEDKKIVMNRADMPNNSALLIAALDDIAKDNGL